MLNTLRELKNNISELTQAPPVLYRRPRPSLSIALNSSVIHHSHNNIIIIYTYWPRLGYTLLMFSHINKRRV